MLTRATARITKWARGRAIIGVFAAFVAFEAVTLPALQRSPGGQVPPLDSQLLFTPATAYATVEAYGDARTFWISIYLTWDVANPLLYSLFLSLLISWLLQRGGQVASKFGTIALLPFGAATFDLLENVSIVTLLATYPRQVPLIAALAAGFSFAKFAVLLGSSLTVLLALLSAAWPSLRRI